MNETETTVYRAVPELVALVAKMREDWPANVIQGVVANAANVGLTWPQTCLGLVRLAVDPEARPGELIPDSRDPLRPRPTSPPTAEWREARAAISEKREK